MKTQALLTGAAIALAVTFASAAAHAANLVSNGDFEADSPPSQTAPADWTLTPAPDGADFFVGSGPGFGAFNGANSANFGAVGGTDDVLSQTLATTAGHSYSISFELAHNSTNSANDFSASFDGITGYSIANTAAFGYTLVSFTGVASTGSTVLAFNGRENPAWYDLDAVDVEDLGAAGVPEPASWALMLTGFLGAGAALRSSRRRVAVAA